MNPSKNFCLLVLLILYQTAPAQIKKVDYNGKQISVSVKVPADFPKEFQNQYLCEGNKPSSDPKARCILLNDDGTGTWQNDYFNANDKPATPIKWYVACSDSGVTSKIVSEGRDQYFVILEFTQQYYSSNPGDKIAFPANFLRSTDGGGARVVIDSKYRDF